MSKTIGGGATVTMNGVRLGNVPCFTFPAGSLKFDGSTEKEIAPGLHDMTMRFTALHDAIEEARATIKAFFNLPEFRKINAMLARRERKRWRRWQRQKRKGG